MSVDIVHRILTEWLVDGSGGPTRRRVLLTVRDGLLSALDDEVGEEALPSGVVRLSQCTTIPALVDAHVHLCMSGTHDPAIRQAQVNADFPQAQAVIAAHLADHLAHGIMAVRDGGDHAAYALRYKLGVLPNTRSPVLLRCAGRGWHAMDRYGRFIGCAPAAGESLTDAVRHCTDPIDHLKVIHSGVNSLVEFGRSTAPQFALDDLSAAIGTASSRGLKTMVHANGETPVREAISAGCHSIEHGYFMGRDNLETLAQRQIVWVPTVVPMAAYARDAAVSSQEAEVAWRTVEHQLEQLQEARMRGVMVSLGTDSGSYGVCHGAAVAEELSFLIQAGYSLESALQCATAHGARLLGLEDQVGRLAAGMPASFVVINGPPEELLANLTDPHSVWVRGEKLFCRKQER